MLCLAAGVSAFAPNIAALLDGRRGKAARSHAEKMTYLGHRLGLRRGAQSARSGHRVALYEGENAFVPALTRFLASLEDAPWRDLCAAADVDCRPRLRSGQGSCSNAPRAGELRSSRFGAMSARSEVTAAAVKSSGRKAVRRGSR